jgi:hypothetical protein
VSQITEADVSTCDVSGQEKNSVRSVNAYLISTIIFAVPIALGFALLMMSVLSLGFVPVVMFVTEVYHNPSWLSISIFLFCIFCLIYFLVWLNHYDHHLNYDEKDEVYTFLIVSSIIQFFVLFIIFMYIS